MTREDEIKNIALCYAHDELKDSQSPIEDVVAAAFIDGVNYADQYPHWISVEEELPKIGWTMSDTVVVTDGNGGLRLAWYHQDEGWHFATGLTFEPTHWMPLPQAPSSSEFPNNCEKGGEE